MLSVQLNLLTEITRKYNIPILLTNQVYSDFDERNAIKIVGGDIITYASKAAISLSSSSFGNFPEIFKKSNKLFTYNLSISLIQIFLFIILIPIIGIWGAILTKIITKIIGSIMLYLLIKY